MSDPTSDRAAVVDWAELARLRAIEAAVREWRDAIPGDSAYQSYSILSRMLDGDFSSDIPDNPPAPLDTDEQISRLLRENELMRGRILATNLRVAGLVNVLAEARRLASDLSERTFPANLMHDIAAK